MIGFKLLRRACQVNQCIVSATERHLSSSSSFKPLHNPQQAQYRNLGIRRSTSTHKWLIAPQSWPALLSLHHPMSTGAPEGGNEEKVGLFKKFKKMWKDYWYVMIPVHIVTSAGWLGGFYVMCKSGLDVPAILAAMGTSQEYLEKISQSDYTYIALSYACYKVATPARYTVTIGGTTLAIRHLTQLGWLKTSNQLTAQGKMSAKLTWEKMAKKRKQ